MPVNLQAKILRATEEKVITRVGDTNQIRTDFRIISATNHEIEKRVEKKQFRLDLLHRLNTLHIHIPALRERPEDIKPLLNYFVDSYSVRFGKPNLKVTKEVYDALLKYGFPGNVRELRNMTERAVILSKGSLLGLKDFPVKASKADSDDKAESVNLRTYEVKLIRKALSLTDFNLKDASELLGIHRDALSRKMKKFNISISKAEQ